jgi:hypothetical protein
VVKKVELGRKRNGELSRVENKLLEGYYEPHGSGIGRQNYIERELSGIRSSGLRR